MMARRSQRTSSPAPSPALPPPPATVERSTGECTLVARVRGGDEAAFETLFAEHYAPLCEFARSLVAAPDVAEDVVQATFLAVWTRRQSWDPADGVRAYLFGACRNRAYDHLRHRRVVAEKSAHITAVIQEEAAARQERPGVTLEADELHAHLSRAVHELPERRRLVVLLRWQHQLSNGEIARVLGISEKGVETQFGRALAALRKRFARFAP